MQQLCTNDLSNLMPAQGYEHIAYHLSSANLHLASVYHAYDFDENELEQWVLLVKSYSSFTPNWKARIIDGFNIDPNNFAYIKKIDTKKINTLTLMKADINTLKIALAEYELTYAEMNDVICAYAHRVPTDTHTFLVQMCEYLGYLNTQFIHVLKNVSVQKR